LGEGRKGEKRAAQEGQTTDFTTKRKREQPEGGGGPTEGVADRNKTPFRPKSPGKSMGKRKPGQQPERVATLGGQAGVKVQKVG